MILIIDFGSQTTHLIGRRIREMGVEVAIIEPDRALKTVRQTSPRGIILSGGPASVYSDHALLVDPEIFRAGIPVLGLCYGLQLMGQMLGGEVKPGKKKEYGPTEFRLTGSSPLFDGYPKKAMVWMSHFDEVVKPPKGGRIIGSTDTVPVAAFADDSRKIYGLQFHPEVHHTQDGIKILRNFVFDICGEKRGVHELNIDHFVRSIRNAIPREKAICALSGGIDSSVAAALAYQAIGDRLVCVYVDTGLMREGETDQIARTFSEKVPLPLKIVHAEKEFLGRLKGVTDPEEKRNIIGETFIRTFEKEAKRSGATVLIQGTIYPDVIESKGTKHAQTIKTHHNVGGIPKSHTFQIVEPLRALYKDQVRELARNLGFPSEMIWRHVFPGPGLAVRMVGEVTDKKLEILRKADRIVEEEIRKAGLYDDIWMAFAVLANVRTTGVGGDERKYGETIALRVIESKDTMSAEWVRLPYEVLARISNRIVTEVFDVTRVVYDITTKPPATMEWE